MHKHTASRHLSSRIMQICICFILAVVSFLLGYGIYYATKVEQFVSVSTNQQVQVTPSVATLPNQQNILLLGSDNDQKFTGNPLTQTMLVVHIDYQKKEVDMFSIPRDLWVKMPGSDTYAKIDQASEYQGIPSAVRVVEDTFGIPIDHYGWVGLYGFIKSIDAVGGVNLDITHPILDNSYPTDINNPNPYGYQRLDIEPGLQHLNGEQALQYVRSRHEDLLGDFGRTERQRQLLNSLKQTIFSSPASIFDIPSIFDALKGQIKTNVTPTLGLQLGYFYIANRNTLIQKEFALLPPKYSKDGTSTDGQSIVIADPGATADLVGSIFGNDAAKTTFKSLSSESDIETQ